MGDSKPIVEFDAVTKRYGKTRALSELTVTIERGLITGLLGPNGSGKSTMLKLMAGLVQPTGGTVLVDGERPSLKTKVKIAYLPEIDYLYGWMSVAETVRFISSFYADWDAKRAEALLDFMHLPADTAVGRLSRGMRARLKLVLAMARNAELVLLDEPLSGIDPPSRSRIIQAIAAEYRSGEQTIAFSTHEVMESESVFDRVMLLDEGRLKLTGNADDVRQEHGKSIQDLLEEVYA
ncbi:MAG: ABC transporter ATP-binding protein [Bacillota bacterium]